MLPEAHVCHRLAHRVRLRIPSRKGNTLYFKRVRERLLQCRGIEDVSVNACTGALLVAHTTDLDTIHRQALEAELFKISLPVFQRKRLAYEVRDTLKSLNHEIERFTGGQLDFSSLALIGFVGLGVYQAMQGRFLVPAISAFWFASTILSGLKPDE